MKLIIVAVVFFIFILMGQEMYGWPGAIGGAGISAVVALIVFRAGSLFGGSGGGGGEGGGGG